MLKIEVIKFEAQDIITNSGTAKPHEHVYEFTDQENNNGELIYRCECGEEIYRKEDRPE